MPSIISTKTSGGGGIAVTGDTSGIMQLASSDGTTAVTIDTNQNATFANTINTPNTFGFKNRIINGAMMIDQRNAGASVTLSTTTQFPVDRFPAYKGTSGATVTAQRSTVVPSGFINSLLFTVSTGASPASGDINGFWQAIEGFNVSDLGYGTANAQTVTLSFWVRSSVTGTYSVSFNNASVDRFYVANYVINSANTWEQKTVTITGDTSGTWNTGNGTGLQIVWDLGYGSSFNGTAGSWGASAIRRISGSVQLAATTGATFYITGVQLEKGSTATSFDYRPYGQELALCQRYYEAFYAINSAYGNGSNGCDYTVYYKVSKRASPTVTIASTSGIVNWPSPIIGTVSTETAEISQSSVSSTGFARLGVNLTISAEL